jgi:hypothetical protein
MSAPKLPGAAGASVGNVSKVKHLLTAANLGLLEALRSGEISIHRAWLWSQGTPEEQREALVTTSERKWNQENY